MDRQSKSWITRKEQKDIKRRITNAAHSNRSKLKRMVRMGRCILIWHIGEDESSIGVPDGKIWAKERVGAKLGPNRKRKEEKQNGNGKDAARNKRWDLAWPHHASRSTVTREFPFTRRSVTSSHVPPFRASSDLLWPLKSQKDWHANKDELCNNRKLAQIPRKSKQAKIESFILYPTFLVLRNAKQIRGNCHNPIFTPGIFSGIDT